MSGEQLAGDIGIEKLRDRVDGDSSKEASLPEVEVENGDDHVADSNGLDLQGVADTSKASPTVSPQQPSTSLVEPLALGPHPADDLHPPDSPTTSLISTLRDQLRLLSDQSQQLNAKLVESISRHADLMDQHEALQSTHRDLSGRADGLAKEKKQWEESMKTGLFVERDVIAGEMQRLAAGLVEEERRRGSAEERRRKVEDEVDELAATLFDQANTMVAQERHGRIEAEERLKATEDNLAAAEAAMRDMQLHLQSMPTSSSGQAPTAPSSSSIAVKRKYLSSHLPYTEYTSFLMHLRSLRPLKETSKQVFPPPLVSALVTQAFLARTLLEDHDPTLRLDIAPDLSWLSRRGISSAIISGDLLIEPVSANSILSTSTVSTYEIGCALCGKPVFPNTVPQSPAISHFGPPPLHPTQKNSSSSRFSLKPFFNATSPSSAPSPTQSPAASPGPAASLPSVYIFRVARASSATTTAAAAEKEKDAKSYPLCRTGWCLERLRATCELWHFVRTGIIHVVWHGDDGYVLQTEIATAAHVAATTPAQGEATGITSGESVKSDAVTSTDVPPELPRRKSGWGLGFSKSTTGSSGGGGGWTKAFRGSVSNSPPVSPRLPTPGDEKVEKPLSVPVGVTEEKEEKLGAPLELDGEKSKEEDESIGAKSETAESEKTASTVEAAERPDIKRALSAGTLDSADGEVTFSTPRQEHDALPSEEKAESEKAAPANNPADDDPLIRKSVDVIREGEITLNSPRTAEGSGSASPSRPAPPPIPRRAAGRNRTSITVEGPSNQGTPSASGTATPIEQDELPQGAETGDGRRRPAAAADGGDIASELGLVPVELPPLPPRHPKTPTMTMPSNLRTGSTVIDGEKAYLKEDDESWEARTWRQVVKLKEEMWRKRLGLQDGGDSSS